MKKVLTMLLTLVMALGLAACGAPAEPEVTAPTGEILLYGEYHNSASHHAQELALWQDWYAKGMRHLFVELGEPTAQLLNRWMAAEDDSLWETIYGNWEGTATHNRFSKEFYEQVKATCPETVFHGFDVEHQFESNGALYLQMLEDEGQKDSDEYKFASATMEQAKEFYAKGGNTPESTLYRESVMAENFIAQYDTLDGLSVMAIAGAAHVDEEIFQNTDNRADMDIMAKLLQDHYGDSVTVTCAVLDADVPARTDTLTINGKEYQAEYFGEEDTSEWLEGCESREFWHVLDAYEDMSSWHVTSNGLPASDYPMTITAGEIYAVLYHKDDGDDWWYAISEEDAEYGIMTKGITPNTAARVDTLTINGKEYQAEYFGEEDVSGWLDGCKSREFWHVIDGYADFSQWTQTNDWLPASNYPMSLNANDSYAVLYHYNSGDQWWYAFSEADAEYGIMTKGVRP